MIGVVILSILGCAARRESNATTASPATSSVVLPPAGTPITFSNLCAACHGVRGEGNVTLRTPSIAGLPEWYVRQELEKFRANQRGHDPRDVEGQRMQAIARLLTAEDVTALASAIAAMERHPTMNTLGGDVRRGLTIYHEYCAACHRYNGSGELAFHSAPLTGLQDWYLHDQLAKFRAGIRGNAAGDEDGAKMRLVATSVKEAQIIDVVAYIAELAKQKP